MPESRPFVARHEVGGVLELCLDRPEKRNALSEELLVQLDEELCRSTDARVVVLTAAGAVFSAGVDIAALHGDARDQRIDRRVRAVADRLRSLAVPTIIAVDQPIYGAASELLLACDGWVFGEAGTVALPSLRMGLLYDPTTMAALQRRIGVAAVTRLVLLQEPIAARDLGAAAVVVSAGTDLPARDRALSIAHGIAAQPHELVATTKAMLRALAGGDDPSDWRQAHRDSFSTDARAAAVASALGRVRTINGGKQ